MKLTQRLLINFLFGLLILGPLVGAVLFDPLMAVALLRVMVSFSPILITVGSGLLVKFWFHL